MQKSHLLITGLLVVVLVALAWGARQMIAPESDVESSELIETGRAHLEAGEYAEAIADLNAAIEANPDSAEAHLLLGQAYNRTNDLLEAKDEFSTVLELDPESSAAHHNLGVTYFQLGSLDAALAEFQVALELDPDAADTHYQLGVVYLNLSFPSGDAMAPPDPQLLEQAAGEFESALALKEGMLEARIGMANIYILQANYSEAIEILQQVIEQKPDSLEAHYALGRAYTQGGDTEKACQTYNHFLTLNPPQRWQDQVEKTIATLGCP